ncbi:far upstream element-binding protein 3 [Cocos nucifera]|uniref:Far upstream element-binding protein 3 n=1 Tax=Cocos nucifera TaxID=13894 RepID=A0A8K0N2K4_COCNU|nr:far upstream element-binding protein 3 [Cocos nucifera]
MAEELQFSSRLDNKRKFEDVAGSPPSPVAAPPPGRRPTGFSGPIVSPDGHSAVAAPPPSYNSVPPPADGIQLAKQRAQEIAARLFSDAEAKRPKVENGGGGADDADDKGFSTDHLQKPLGQQIASQVGVAPPPSYSMYGYQGSSKEIRVPNGRVGVIIGKGGETIKYLQLQSGAKIQVTRDADADPNSATRPVDLMGTPEQISKAEQLIKDVLAEADAGGSGIVAARKFGGGQVGAEQFIMKVPNNKVGLVIGKGGETIKNLQAKSGARIQLIPLHLPPGDTSTERTVQIDGTKEQIESAKQLVNEVTSENRVRNPHVAGGYSQQGYRPSRPPMSWGPPGPPPVQQPGYGYMQPGAYPGQPPQYNMSQPPYMGYPPPASGGFSSGWDQPSNPPTQQTTPGTGYDYYNQQQQPHQQQPLGGSSAPAENTTYGYGQPPSYNSQGQYSSTTYSQAAVDQQQGYGQDNYSGGYHAPASQPGYSQAQSNPPAGYDHQQGYGSTPTYAASTNPSHDGSTSTHGAQSGPTQVPSSQQAPPVQPTGPQQGYTSQPQGTTSPAFPSQGTGQPGYGMPPTSQPGYGNQLLTQTGYGQSMPFPQPGYGQSSPAQKPPTQPVYVQAQQPQTTQTAYIQPAPVQPGYSHGQPPPAQSTYGSVGPQHSYGQQQPYGSVPPQSQSGYVQQQQQYTDSYGGSVGGYSRQSGAVHGSYDAPAVTQAIPSGVAKASPKS